MLEKFKNLSKGKKVIVGIIAFLLLPITLFVLSFNLAVDGAKNKKVGKVIIGVVACAFIIFSAFVSNQLSETPKTDTAEGDDTTVEATNTETETEESKLTTEELLKKLETYEGIYAVIPATIQDISATNDTLEMQKTFADGRDILEKGWQDLSDLRKNYDSKSDEYLAIENLHMAFYTLRDACKNGIKYLDKNEYKYFEKYEDDCASAGAWLNDYLVYKQEIK